MYAVNEIVTRAVFKETSNKGLSLCKSNQVSSKCYNLLQYFNVRHVRSIVTSMAFILLDIGFVGTLCVTVS